MSSPPCPKSCNLSDSDTGFMIMATTFVMLQTPALGLCQAGLIRRKNALSMLMQVLGHALELEVQRNIYILTLRA